MDDLSRDDVLARKAEIRALIGERGSRLATAVALVELGFEAFGAPYRKAEVSAAELAAIRDNAELPEEVDVLPQRVLEAPGVAEVAWQAAAWTNIYLDHHAASFVRDDIAKDAEREEAVEAIAADTDALVAKAISLGLSQYGVASVLILNAAAACQKAGFPRTKVARVLADAIKRTVAGDLPVLTPVDQLGMVAKHMGVSRATARKYMSAAKKRHRRAL